MNNVLLTIEDVRKETARVLAKKIVDGDKETFYGDIYKDVLSVLEHYEVAVRATERAEIGLWSMQVLAFYPQAQQALLEFLSKEDKEGLSKI